MVRVFSLIILSSVGRGRCTLNSAGAGDLGPPVHGRWSPPFLQPDLEDAKRFCTTEPDLSRTGPDDSVAPESGRVTPPPLHSV